MLDLSPIYVKSLVAGAPVGRAYASTGGGATSKATAAGGVLTVVAQAGADLADTHAPQQTDCRVAQQRHDGPPLPLMGSGSDPRPKLHQAGMPDPRPRSHQAGTPDPRPR